MVFPAPGVLSLAAGGAVLEDFPTATGAGLEAEGVGAFTDAVCLVTAGPFAGACACLEGLGAAAATAGLLDVAFFAAAPFRGAGAGLTAALVFRDGLVLLPAADFTGAGETTGGNGAALPDVCGRICADRAWAVLTTGGVAGGSA
jgi:hypothetical protein